MLIFICMLEIICTFEIFGDNDFNFGVEVVLYFDILLPQISYRMSEIFYLVSSEDIIDILLRQQFVAETKSGKYQHLHCSSGSWY
jgi:hypothetical protein